MWKDIENYEGIYQVSDSGEVRSLGNGKSPNSKERIMKVEETKCGYLRVQLCKDGKQKHFSIHRLVAEAFIPNPLNLPQVNHKNENKHDNRAENLEWCNCSYNINYGTRNEKVSKGVIQYRLDGSIVREWSSTYEVERQLGFNHIYIGACCRGNTRSKTGYGFIWKYKKEVK